jgi:hypothetical protein
MPKLGIVQSRGIGDIIMALPIARHYYELGYEIHWPVCEEFVDNFNQSVDWVDWIPLVTDSQGEFFYQTPVHMLSSLGCEEIIPLYQALSGHPEFSNANWFQIQKFDEYKYTAAGVPFIKKWTLASCIKRNLDREQDLKDQLDIKGKFVLYHVQGSDFRAPIDLSNIPPELQTIEITPITNCVFDWIGVMEQAQALILVDSVFANLADQLNLSTDKYWIPRSHIHLTPVLGSDWTILKAPEKSLAARKMFSTK